MTENLPEKRSLLYKISKIISDFFNPLTSLFIFFVYYAWKHYSWRETVNEFLPLLLILILPVSLWIIWNVKSGKYTNMDVSNRNQRKSLYIVIAAALIVYLIVKYLIEGQIDYRMVFLFLLLILMQISNYFIKSSMHTALNIFTAALFFSESVFLGSIWLIIAFFVGITRIILKRHTPGEVMMGAFLGIVVSFAYLYTNIQLHH